MNNIFKCIDGSYVEKGHRADMGPAGRTQEEGFLGSQNRTFQCLALSKHGNT